MSWSDWLVSLFLGLGLALVVTLSFAGVLKGRSCRTHSVGMRWPVDVPDTMTVGDVDYAFSPTGGYIHVTYKPKEESR